MEFQEINGFEFDSNGLVRVMTTKGQEINGQRIITHPNHIEVFNKGDDERLKAFLGESEPELIEYIIKKWSEL